MLNHKGHKGYHQGYKGLFNSSLNTAKLLVQLWQDWGVKIIIFVRFLKLLPVHYQNHEEI